MRICESLAEHLKRRVDRVNKEMVRIKSNLWPTITFIQTLPIYHHEDQGTIQIMYDGVYSFNQSIHISVEGYPYQQIVEEIAGPIHQNFGWNWKLSIDGTPEVPHFNLSNIKSTDPLSDVISIRISITEGEVKTCRVEKRIVKVLTFDEVIERHFEGNNKNIYEQVMICEEV